MHDCVASFSRQNIVEILSFHLWGVYYGRSEGGARNVYADHHLRALQSWPTNRSTHLKDWSCHRSGLYYESGDGFLVQQFFWVCYHLQYHCHHWYLIFNITQLYCRKLKEKENCENYYLHKNQENSSVTS